jgi:N,N-dimethylformamidase beta subunit-like, C-terminal/Concanavalin A-like lectin/glucanases superfamily
MNTLVGYADRLSVFAGEEIGFKVSCRSSTFHADIVRLVHGDESPEGPGFKEELLETTVSGEYRGRVQPIRPGSYVIVPNAPPLQLGGSFEVRAHIFPTAPAKGVQGLVTHWSGSRGWGLFLGTKGNLELWLGQSDGRVVRISSGAALDSHSWYLVTGSYNAERRVATLFQDGQVVTSSGGIAPPTHPGEGAPLLIGAHWTEEGNPEGYFNGKIGSPRLYGHALQPGENDTGPIDAVAYWDLSANIETTFVRDTSPNKLHGRIVNMAARGVTGCNWSGDRWSWGDAPEQYGAIHFHDDDLEDAGWVTDFTLAVTSEFPSGVYAARLRSGDAEDHVPFIVRPVKGKPAADIAVVLPTYTYLAYANETIFEPHVPLLERDEDRWAAENQLTSLYNRHSDGSGVFYASRLKPMMNLRPRYRYWLTGHPHGLGADLCLLDWLEARGHCYDVLTDEDVHHEGVDLLGSYRVVLTGAHPEYTTSPMMCAFKAFLDGGGRLMYVAGNGFWMVTGVHAERPHVIEIRRRSPTSGLWGSEPGEVFLSTTGELGDTWQQRRERPRQLVGVGFERMVLEGRPYRREAGSFDRRAAFVFEGVEPEELIGNFGLLLGGAASYEVDGVDVRYGTPSHALLLARASGFTPVGTPELDHHPRADMVFFETPNGGAVFATGSIGWCAALSHNGYDNNVSRITENVLLRFLSEDALSNDPVPRRV